MTKTKTSKAPKIEIWLEWDPEKFQFSYTVMENGVSVTYSRSDKILVDFLEEFLEQYYAYGTEPHLEVVGKEEN